MGWSISNAARGWLRMISHSSGVSGPGFFRMLSGTPILPMSCSSAPRRTWTSSSALIPSSRPMRTVISVTRSVCCSVTWSRRSSARAQPPSVASYASVRLTCERCRASKRRALSIAIAAWEASASRKPELLLVELERGAVQRLEHPLHVPLGDQRHVVERDEALALEQRAADEAAGGVEQVREVQAAALERGDPRDPLAEPQARALDAGAAEAAARRVLEGLGVRVEQQHVRGVDAELLADLVDEPGERHPQVEARADRQVDLVQRRQVPEPGARLGLGAGALRDVLAGAERRDDPALARRGGRRCSRR